MTMTPGRIAGGSISSCSTIPRLQALAQRNSPRSEAQGAAAESQRETERRESERAPRQVTLGNQCSHTANLEAFLATRPFRCRPLPRFPPPLRPGAGSAKCGFS